MHTKVFVGNLSFKTKADELAAEFSPAGRVVSANIITRGPRSLGYGFVELESEEEARKAVTLLNKRSVDGREINVEIAKPRDEAKIAERRQARDSGPRRGGRRGGRGRGFEGAPADSGSSNNNNNANANPSPNASSPSDAPQGGAPRSGGFGGRGGRSRFRPRGGAAAPAGGSTAGGAPGSSSAPAGGDSSAPPRERRPRGPRGPRGPPRNRDLNTRTASNTTLFVANLPFALDDAGLAALFKDNKVAKAHVVKNRNDRSKGFGFVEFETEADQKAALASAEKLTVDTRQLIVKIALTPPEGLGAPQAPAAASAAAPAPAAAAAAEKEPAPKDAKAEAPKSS